MRKENKGFDSGFWTMLFSDVLGCSVVYFAIYKLFIEPNLK